MKQLPDLKLAYSWLSNINSQSLQQSIGNLDKAFTAFFRYGASYPKFKKKTNNQSFSCPQHSSVNFQKDILVIPKFKEGIKTVFNRTFEGNIKNIVISKTPTNKYFASILVDNEIGLPYKKDILEKSTVGIDLGIKDFAILSTREKIANPKYLRESIERLKILQRRASKKKKGSKNRKKANLKVALLHEKITNQRKDFLQKVSTKIINSHDTICVENLNIKGMSKNHKLSQAILDVGWRNFIRMLKYKAEWYGKNILEIPTFSPSTKICSNCGLVNHSLTLADRKWICKDCNMIHDRDVNAAINIKNHCLRTQARVLPMCL